MGGEVWNINVDKQWVLRVILTCRALHAIVLVPKLEYRSELRDQTHFKAAIGRPLELLKTDRPTDRHTHTHIIPVFPLSSSLT